jgi:hypothetical protein
MNHLPSRAAPDVVPVVIFEMKTNLQSFVIAVYAYGMGQK